MPYHRALADSLTAILTDPARLESAAGTPVVTTLGGIAPRGLNPPLLHTSPWETALARGTLTHIEYGTIASLLETYQLQDKGIGQTVPLIAQVIYRPTFFEPERNREILQFLQLVSNELAAQEAYSPRAVRFRAFRRCSSVPTAGGIAPMAEPS